MPLDANKIAHIQAILPKTWAERQKTVVFVYQSGGTYSYVATSVIFRPQSVIDPEILDVVGGQPRSAEELLMVVPITTNMTGIVYIADTTTSTASAVASAAKYQIIEVVPTGIIPTGTHYVVYLRRMR
ncbi:MAG TPA: hypothetical protein VH593_14420 [Ktedonobacteraceae bacterium]